MYKFYVLYANTEADGHMGSCPGTALLIFHGKATKPREDEFRERIGRIMERTLAGEGRMETYRYRIAGRASPREEKSSSEERYRGCA